ncbi:MAG TPA: cytochrome c [Gaiellaceae bacterium]|nr:cytochrome c [Gaiellaceae bacterium]
MADHGSESLARWLVSGLVAGAVILGLLIGAYAIGYHRGQHHAAQATAASAPPPTTTAPATTTAATTTAPATSGPVTATPALVARGKQLFASDGCVGCHSLSGASGAGPSLEGLAGGTVKLTSGKTVTADDAYLVRSIVDPDAEIVSGYKPGIMSAAVAGFGLAAKPDDVKALVAFVKSRS